MQNATETAICIVGTIKKSPIKATVKPRYKGCLTTAYMPVVTKPKDSGAAEMPRKTDKLMSRNANFNNHKPVTITAQPIPKMKEVRSNNVL